MRRRLTLLVLLVLTLLIALASPAKADGIIIPPPPCRDRGCPPPPPRPMIQLAIRYHHVDVTIADQLATTRVDQVFYNPNDFPVEGTYIFPLPQNAAVKDFTLWVDGNPVEGKVLSAEEARGIYEDTVRNLRDPALLEYVGRGAVQANVFPIPSRGERRIALEYTEVLTAENGLVRYSYPLNTEKFSIQPLEDVKIKVDIRSSQPIRAVYSASHTVDIVRKDGQNVTASYDATNITPDTDFTLYYSIGESQALHLFTYRDPGDRTDTDGFFLLLLAPQPGAVTQTIAKDVLLVLDRSGSMEGEKFQQAQAALKYVLTHLNREDRFHLLTFSTDIQMYASELRPASDAPEALQWASQLSAAGSTDINRALLDSVAVADPERPTYLIFLTDGLPTEGVTDSQLILNNLQAVEKQGVRLFAFGVGYDVDTFLLDSLSEQHHGLSTYVQPGQALDEVLSGFYARISTPVLTDLSLDFGDLRVYDIYPQPLPDLFSGSQVVVAGRYREGGRTDIRLSGSVNGRAQTFTFAEQNFVEDSRAIRNAPVELPRLWATRKIGTLLNQIRLKGPNQEIINQIVRLSIRYGIVTPYTSFLVTEPMPLSESTQQRVVQDTYNNLLSEPTAPSSGQAAVQKAAGQGAMAQAEAPAALPEDVSQKVRNVGSRTFVQSAGVWMDTSYDPETMQAVPVSFLSPDYFTLSSYGPDTAAALALGERVILFVDGKAYEIVPSTQNSAPLELQPTVTTPPTDLPVSPISTAPKIETPDRPTSTAANTETPQPAKSRVTPMFYLLSCLGGILTLGLGMWAFKKK